MGRPLDYKEDTIDDGTKEMAMAGAPMNPELEEILSWSPEEYAERERRLLRKMDIRLVPWMT